MAIYCLRVTPISRGLGRSAIGAAAYRTRGKIYNEYDGTTHDYTRRKSVVKAASYRSGENDFIYRKDVAHSEIMLPKHALKEWQDRHILWNSVEKSEKNSNARTAREVLVALPNELNTEQQIEIVRDYVQRNFVDKGMIADFSIHSGHIHDREDEKYPLEGLTIRKENPHAHIQLTVRPLNDDGTWGAKSKKEYILDKNGNKIKLPSGEWKSRKIPATNWDKVETLKKWRENWAATINKKFEELAISERIDHRTLKAQGIDREPTKHIGVIAWNLEKKGIATEQLKEHREIVARNKEREQQAKVRFYGVESELTGEEYSKILFDNEVEHIGKFSRQQLQQNRKIDGSIKWYKANVQKIEREIAELSFERQKTSIFDFKRRKSIKEQVENLSENKARFETAFLKKYNVELENADILRTEQEELQVSKNYLEAKKIKGALGKLKFEYIQNRSLQGQKRIEFLQKQQDEIAKIELKINDLQSKRTSVSSKKGLALEWETLQREKLTQKLIDEVVADIIKIKYSSAIQRNQAQEQAIPPPNPPEPETQAAPAEHQRKKQQETPHNQPTTAEPSTERERQREREQEIAKRRELRNYQRKYYNNEKSHDYERSR